MKIKTLIACIGAFITLISGIGFNTLNTKKEVNQTENIIIADVVDSENNNDFNENLVIELDEKDNEIFNTEEKNTEETQETTIKIKETQVNEIKNDLPKKSENNQQNKSTTSVKTNTEPKQETKSENVEKRNTEEQITKELTPSDLGYWCAEGGTHHVAGDGANEHGYYSSWNEAQVAFENYTKGWASVQYKISQCLCGKYYFWAIQ